MPLAPLAIFFDTNALLGAGWPAPSAQLLQVLDQAQGLGITLGLPDVVAKELGEHWLRDVMNDWRAANSGIERLNRRARAVIEYESLPALPSRDSLLESVAKFSAAFTARFTLVAVTTRPLTDFLDLAIMRGATFEEGGRGFQDAVILSSILDHMKESGVSRAVLVSADKAFQSQGAKQLISASAVDLQIISSVDELEDLLKAHLNALVNEYYEKQQRILLEELNKRLAEIEKYIIANLTVTPSDLGQWNTNKINSLRVNSIAAAHATEGRAWWELSPAPAKPGQVRISADVNVTVDLEIQQYSGPPEKRFKVGGEVSQPPATTIEAAFGLANWLASPATRELLVVVEAEATKTDAGYSDVTFTGAHIKGETFGSLASLITGK